MMSLAASPAQLKESLWQQGLLEAEGMQFKGLKVPLQQYQWQC
jgi:hypothetical protein